MKISMKKIKNIISEEMKSAFPPTLGHADIQKMVLAELTRYRRELGEASDAPTTPELNEGEDAVDFSVDYEVDDSELPADKHDHAIYGGGGVARMARSQLFRIAKFAHSLYDRLDDQDELPEWVQSKVATMADSMDAVHGHLDHKMSEMGFDAAAAAEED